MQTGPVEEAGKSAPGNDISTPAPGDASQTGELKNIIFTAPTGWIVQCMMYQEFCDIRNPLQSILINVSAHMCVYDSEGEKVTPQYPSNGWTEHGTWTFLASDVPVWSIQNTLSQKLGFFLDAGSYCWQVDIEYPKSCMSCEQMAQEILEMASQSAPEKQVEESAAEVSSSDLTPCEIMSRCCWAYVQALENVEGVPKASIEATKESCQKGQELQTLWNAQDSCVQAMDAMREGMDSFLSVPGFVKPEECY
jgi:hypothetical protein